MESRGQELNVVARGFTGVVRYASMFRSLWAIRIGLALLGLVIFYPGLWQGIGATPEEVRRVAIAVDMLSTGDLNPHWYGHPASLLVYGLAGIYKLVGWWSGGVDWRQVYLTDPEPLFVIGRVLARLSAALAVVFTFELGRSLLPLPWAVMAAISTAINPVFVMSASRLRADHLLTIFLLLAVLGLIRMQRRCDPLTPWLLAALAGVAVTFKYLAMPILACVLLALAARDGFGRRQILTLLGLTSLFLLVVFLFSPYLFLDWRTAFADVIGETSKRNDWRPLLAVGRIVAACRYAFSSVGFVLLVLACLRGIRHWFLIGLPRWKPLVAWLANRGGDPWISMTLLTVIYMLQTLSASSYNVTWLAPVVPMLTLAVFRQLRDGWRMCRTWSGNQWLAQSGSFLALVLMVAMLSQQALEWRLISKMRSLPGITAVAQSWLSSHVKPGDRVLFMQASGREAIGFFPRIAVRDVELHAWSESGSVGRVCPGEQGDGFETTGRLLEAMECYPRPFMRSFQPAPLLELVKKYDFVVLTSVARIEAVDQRIFAGTRPILQLSRPPIVSLRDYPQAYNFPHGDYGNWREIRIYARSGLGP